MMISLVRLILMSDQCDAMLQILHSIVPVTQAKPGCVSCGAFEEYDAEHSILYPEQWETEGDLHQHILSAQYLRILIAMDLAKDPPQTCFHEFQIPDIWS